MIVPSMTINEVVRKYPDTMKVFNRFGLDTCCGGFEKIEDAARSAKADMAKLLEELTAVALNPR